MTILPYLKNFYCFLLKIYVFKPVANKNFNKITAPSEQAVKYDNSDYNICQLFLWQIKRYSFDINVGLW